MHTLKLEVEDSVIDKVKTFLKQLPQNTVKIKEDSVKQVENVDFIEFLISNPIQVKDNENFFSRIDANAR